MGLRHDFGLGGIELFIRQQALGMEVFQIAQSEAGGGRRLLILWGKLLRMNATASSSTEKAKTAAPIQSKTRPMLSLAGTV